MQPTAKKSLLSVDLIIFVAAFLVALACLIKFVNLIDIQSFLVSQWKHYKQLFTVGGLSLTSVLIPTIFPLLIANALTWFYPKSTPTSKAIASGLLIFFGFRYFGWRFFSTLNLDDWIAGTFSICFFLAEATMFLDAVLATFIETVPTSDIRAEADEYEKNVLSGDYLPSVDVLIPTYNESAEILKRTIMGCQALDYPNKKIYLLDDTRRPEMRKLAEELGCFYLDRPDNKHAKAGNINNALKYIDSDLIAIFDADFLPTTNFLKRTVGFFQESSTAIVQTPHNFYTPDPIEYNLGLEGKITNEQEFFFRHIMPSKAAVNAAICCGTCFVIRRSALDEIGGIPTESITEDFFTSIRLQIKGYYVKYLHELLSAGEAPGNIGAYIDQRLRWGQGIMQSLFCSSNPITTPGLSFAQRLYYYSSISYWIMPVLRMFVMMGPCIYLVFGLQPLRATLDGILFFFLPFYVGNLLLLAWFTKGARSLFWSDVYDLLICIPMGLTILRMIKNPFGKGFKVTPKGLTTEKLTVNWNVAKPLVALFLICFVSLIIRSVNLMWADDKEPVFVNIVWASYGLIVLWVTILASMDIPKSQNIYFQKQLACQIFMKGVQINTQTEKISETDAFVRLPSLRDLAGELKIDIENPNQAKVQDFLAARVTIPELELFNLPVKIKPQPDSDISLMQFSGLTVPQHRKLVELLFCQPGQWKPSDIDESTFSYSFFRSFFRMNPLANG